MDDDEFLALLERASAPDLETAFGPDLERIRWKYAVQPGRGERSLAVVRALLPPTLEVDETFGNPKLQLRYDDPDPPTYLAVTDVRASCSRGETDDGSSSALTRSDRRTPPTDEKTTPPPENRDTANAGATSVPSKPTRHPRPTPRPAPTS